MIGERVLLRVYMLSTDQVRTLPAYEWLVQRARRHPGGPVKGATILRGIYGFGRRGISHDSPWHLANSVPVIFEIVDDAPVIVDFLTQEIAPHLRHGLVTLERAAVMMYRRRGGDEQRAPLELLARIKDLSTVPVLAGSPDMKTNEDGILLRIFAGESDQHEGKPLYQAVVAKARELGLAGATVLKGSMGFGANSVLHTTKILEFSTDLPILMELVDSQESIQKLLPALDGMVHEGMITMETVRIIAYRHNPADTKRPH